MTRKRTDRPVLRIEPAEEPKEEVRGLTEKERPALKLALEVLEDRLTPFPHNPS